MVFTISVKTSFKPSTSGYFPAKRMKRGPVDNQGPDDLTDKIKPDPDQAIVKADPDGNEEEHEQEDVKPNVGKSINFIVKCS